MESLCSMTSCVLDAVFGGRVEHFHTEVCAVDPSTTHSLPWSSCVLPPLGCSLNPWTIPVPWWPVSTCIFWALIMWCDVFNCSVINTRGPPPKKKKTLCHFYFYTIFGFCWPILAVISPLQSEMISTHIWNKSYCLTLIVLWHLVWKDTQVQFCE